MSLQSLEWRKLPVRILPNNINATSSYYLDTIYDMLTGSVYYDGSARVGGSGSGWQNVTRFITGSNTEAVYCYPPFQTVLSQSVIFSAKNTTGTSSAATPPVLTNETAYGTGYIFGTLVKNASGSFTQWTSTFPFGSGSYSLGYTRATDFLGAGGKVIIYESKEAIALITQNTTGTRVFIAGAIIDPEQTSALVDAESDGRLYGVASSGNNTSINTAFLNSYTGTTDLFNHSGTAGAVKFVMFTPQANSTFTAQMEKYYTNIYGSYNTMSGKLVPAPLRCYGGTNNNFLGRMRDITAIKNSQSNQVLRDSVNNVIGFTISNLEGSTNNAVVLNYY
jgi:hypothetical protein